MLSVLSYVPDTYSVLTAHIPGTNGYMYLVMVGHVSTWYLRVDFWYLWVFVPGTCGDTSLELLWYVPGTCFIFQRRVMMSYWSERRWAICILLRIAKLLIVFFVFVCFVLCYCEINWSNIDSFFFVFLLFLYFINNTEATLVLISMGRGGVFFITGGSLCLIL